MVIPRVKTELTLSILISTSTKDFSVTLDRVETPDLKERGYGTPSSYDFSQSTRADYILRFVNFCKW